MEKRTKVLRAERVIKEKQMEILIQIATPVMVAMVQADLQVQAEVLALEVDWMVDALQSFQVLKMILMKMQK